MYDFYEYFPDKVSLWTTLLNKENIREDKEIYCHTCFSNAVVINTIRKCDANSWEFLPLEGTLERCHYHMIIVWHLDHSSVIYSWEILIIGIPLEKCWCRILKLFGIVVTVIYIFSTGGNFMYCTPKIYHLHSHFFSWYCLLIIFFCLICIFGVIVKIFVVWILSKIRIDFMNLIEINWDLKKTY